MYLHEAIAKVLQETGRAMTTTEIADAINTRHLYSRGDNAPIRASQISARLKYHWDVFVRVEGKIKLK